MGDLPTNTSGTTISDFSDTGLVADYAKDELNALISGGIVSGGNGKLNPLNNCTRAEMAQVLTNLLSMKFTK